MVRVTLLAFYLTLYIVASYYTGQVDAKKCGEKWGCCRNDVGGFVDWQKENNSCPDKMKAYCKSLGKTGGKYRTCCVK
jgi:hypothetical protein